MSTQNDLGEREVAYLLEVVELARNGETARLEDEVAAGISENLTNAAGDTLLILAAYHGHHDTVAMLLRRGADHARINGRGQTALGAAVFRQHVEMVQALLTAGADPDLGAPSAIEVAEFFGLSLMTAVLRGSAPGKVPGSVELSVFTEASTRRATSCAPTRRLLRKEHT